MPNFLSQKEILKSSTATLEATSPEAIIDNPAPMNSKIKPSWIPWVLYPAGDFIAQLITGDISLPRLIALSLAGGTIYQFEVPRWFRWLDQRTFSATQLEQWPFLQWITLPHEQHYRLNWIGRTLGAMSYFSPIWITRHMLILKIATTPWADLVWPAVIGSLFLASCKSFLVNLPFSILGNYIIQARLPLKYRFLGSIIMTGLFSIAFALAFKFFQ